MGAALLTLHRTNEALTHLERAVQVRPTHPYANTNLGFVVSELGRPAEALEHFRRAVRLKPEMPLPWVGLVKVNLELGQPVAARTAYGILGMLDPRLAASIGPTLLTTW
jgi:Flp pilus assembly protein TadD